MKNIYLIRHSAPFVELYESDKMTWNEYNKNMILSSEGEENAKKLCSLNIFKNVDLIYSSNSYRAISTSKYVAEMNNLPIRIDDRINERSFGINLISDLPNDFVKNQFTDKDLKYKDGESLNDVNIRFDNFIRELLDNDKESILLFIHGIVLMSYLSTLCDVEFDNNIFKIIYKDNIIFNNKMKNLEIFKLTFDNKKLISIENIIL